MIIDTLRSAGYYFNIHPGLESGFAFISDALRSGLEDGEYGIDDRKVYAAVCSCDGVGEDKAKLEAHKKYIDIHFCLEGAELIGWEHIDECMHSSGDYDSEKDIQFFSDKPHVWTSLAGDRFGIFFPHDAHAPLAGKGACRKVIVKIQV